MTLLLRFRLSLRLVLKLDCLLYYFFSVSFFVSSSFCLRSSTSYPGGNKVDGLPPALSLAAKCAGIRSPSGAWRIVPLDLGLVATSLYLDMSISSKHRGFLSALEHYIALSTEVSSQCLIPAHLRERWGFIEVRKLLFGEWQRCWGVLEVPGP